MMLGRHTARRARRRLARVAALNGDKGAKVRINNNLYPVIASVSASHCIVEIGRERAREDR